MLNTLVVLASLLAIPGASFAETVADAPIAPELSGLGSHHFAVSTTDPRAQRFFDQGLRLLYAFNHPEAMRAFKEAARLDPDLAMAYWGQAMVLGPNLNQPMPAENVAPAFEAAMAARRLAYDATRRERALIAAIAVRFPAAAGGDRKALDHAYAAAMKQAAAEFPADADVLTLYADAVMNVSPWDYYEKNGSAKPLPALAIAALERAITIDANHPGALHYHIHALEASNEPERAEASADRLLPLMPAAGHMVHMPAHIYLRVGRYKDAADVNELAIRADEDYLAQCQAQGLYPVSYYPHNLHFLWAASTLEGRRAAAIDAARQTAAKVPHHHAGQLAWTADFPVTPMLAYARFGAWRDMLTEPKPPADQPYAVGIWHYGRALGFVARGQLDRAGLELAALATIKTHEAFKTTLKDYPLLANLEIASRMAEGELRAEQGNYMDAVRVLEEAVALDDAFPYAEPPLWHHPPRQVLGAVLLEAGRAGDAEAVYRDDLKRFRENGWSLFGLTLSLEAQGRQAEAAAVRARFARAWSRSDITLTSSRIIADDRGGRLPPARNATADRGQPARATLSTGVTLEYVEQGPRTGTPVILLHGITDSWRSFERVLPHLPSSLRVIAVSLRGHGGSSRPHAGYRAEDMAGDVDLLMEALDLPPALVVGHSMGSGVALRLALDHPARVGGLVLVGGSASWNQNPVVQEAIAMGTSVQDPIDAAMVREFQLSTLVKPVPPEVVDTAVAESLKLPVHVWHEAFSALLHHDVVDRLPELRVPVRLIWGEHDTLATRADQEAVLSQVPGARLSVYEGHGHAPHWEDPARVAQEIAAFANAHPHVLH
jgi:pimeloyl-ACP methyl ester carboxylesterase/tetratricopeptide (TPR) repeat protein